LGTRTWWRRPPRTDRPSVSSAGPPEHLRRPLCVAGLALQGGASPGSRMSRRLFQSLIAALLLAFAAGPAWAEVTLTFYAHPGARIRGGDLLFPHAFVHATGTLDDTGEAVDWAAGFTAKNPGPQLLFARGAGVVLEPEPRYVGEGRSYLSLVVTDEVYRAVRARADWWNGPDGSVYDLRRRHCITFVADLARLAGLQTAEEPSMKPG